jgi:hypothetical protein
MSKEAIITAINRLVKVDPNLAANLNKLADLAEKKPSIYQSAVEYLKKL